MSRRSNSISKKEGRRVHLESNKVICGDGVDTHDGSFDMSSAN